METKILSILMISLLIVGLSFVEADVSTTISEVSQGQVVKVTESVEISQVQIVKVTKKCYSDEGCKDILCVIPIDGDYEVYKKCNLSTQKCYCDLYRVVDYNEKFVLTKGQTAIIPEGYFITLEDIYGVCKMNDYCYSIARLSYFDGKKFYLKEGESKQFGDDVIPTPKERPVLKLLKIENNEAIFIVYPTYEVTVNVTEINITEINVTVEATPTITAEIIKVDKVCEGCILDNKCVPIAYRTLDKYCDADKSLKNQKQEDEDCNNNFECESNVCIDSKCISGGLIQKILDFFKKLFGL